MTTTNPATKIDQGANAEPTKHTLPLLPYDYEALEPVIDARTMLLHHDHHHASYVKKLNRALEEFPDFQSQSASWLLLNLGKLPAKIRTVVRHNAGGHLNHSMFWMAMSPAGHDAPTGALAAAIERDFGSFEEFKERFVAAGAKLFGSGWVWLAESRLVGGKLKIFTTNGHGNPLTSKRFPILLNDVWEHAYYLKYENRRDDYLRKWWSIVNWEQAGRRFDRAPSQTAEHDWDNEGGQLQDADS